VTSPHPPTNGALPATTVDLDTVDRLLGMPAGYPSWRIADRAIRKGILATWLSSAIARDIEISDGAHA
jgi:hypothetical protein